MAATTTTAVAIRDPTIAAIEAYPMALEEVRYKNFNFRITHLVLILTKIQSYAVPHRMGRPRHSSDHAHHWSRTQSTKQERR